MESRDLYQNANDPYRQQPRQEQEQTELYEYENGQKSTAARLGNLFSSTVLSKSPEALRNAPNNLLDSLPPNVNRTLLFAKLFYFWYFAAFGSLFPLMSIYFKQMGMGPSYCGILMGFRPFVEFISAPFWSVVSTRFRQAKQILMMAVVSWIVFTVAIGLIKPPPHSCLREMNATHQAIERVGYATSTFKPTSKFIVKRQATNLSPAVLNKTKESIDRPNRVRTTSTTTVKATLTSSRRRKTTTRAPTTTRLPFHVNQDDDDIDSSDEDNQIITSNRIKSTTKPAPQSNINYLMSINKPGKSMGNPLSITHTNVSLVKPLASSVLYDKKDVRNVFMVFLLLIIVGEFFSAPAITLADACTLSYLGQDTELYGRQRMFGSLGWGLAIFIVATILDQSKSLTFHACGTSGPLEKNYTVCFAAFSVCMTFALISASRFEFSYDKSEQQPLRAVNDETKRQAAASKAKPFYPTDSGMTEQYQASNTIRLMQIIQIFMTLKNGTFLFIAWWMGCGVGLVFTFLFWHLQDLGGSPTLFGVASVINHTSELLAYFFLHELIHRFGHIKILYLGLLGNFVRFVYISIITNPWWVLPFEFIQGLTHAAVWATACSYLSQAAPESLRISCQGVLQGFHFGFGRGCGALFGGFFASSFGTDKTFRVYGVICLILMGLFTYFNEYRQRQQTEVDGQHGGANIGDPHEMSGNPPLLAPHGAPGNPKWQTKFSAGLTAGIKEDAFFSSSSTTAKPQSAGSGYNAYQHGY